MQYFCVFPLFEFTISNLTSLFISNVLERLWPFLLSALQFHRVDVISLLGLMRSYISYTLRRTNRRGAIFIAAILGLHFLLIDAI